MHWYVVFITIHLPILFWFWKDHFKNCEPRNMAGFPPFFVTCAFLSPPFLPRHLPPSPLILLIRNLNFSPLLNSKSPHNVTKNVTVIYIGFVMVFEPKPFYCCQTRADFKMRKPFDLVGRERERDLETWTHACRQESLKCELKYEPLLHSCKRTRILPSRLSSSTYI